MKVKTDFTNTEEFPKMEEGKQVLKVFECFTKQSKAGNEMIVFNFENLKKQRVYLHCVNTDENRWKLKQVLEALTGQKQEKGPVEFDTEDLINLKLMGNVFNEEFEGKTYPKVGDVGPCLADHDLPF